MDAFIIACLALRRRVEEKRSPDPEFQPFRLEFIRSVTDDKNNPESLSFVPIVRLDEFRARGFGETNRPHYGQR
jgi:hypothetical protein